MTNIRGQIAMMPEEKPCYCSEPKPHWHAYQAIFDGDRWLPMTSQAGIDLVMALQDEGTRRQAEARATAFAQHPAGGNYYDVLFKKS